MAKLYGSSTESNGKRSSERRCWRGHGHPVAGDADEADQALLPGLDHGLQRAARSEGGLPLLRLDQVVQLDQVEVVDPQSLQRALDLARAPSSRVRSPVLVARKNVVAVGLHPGTEPQLGVAVAGARCRCG